MKKNESNSLKICYYYNNFITGSGAVGLAHCDGAGTEEGIMTMVSRVQELALGYPEGRLQLQLIGGYSDPHNYSEELFYNILRMYLYFPFSCVKYRKFE